MIPLKQNIVITAFLLGLADGATQRVNDTSLLESTSLRLLYQNNLNASDDRNHAGAILLDPMTRGEGETACSTLGESLIDMETLQTYSLDYFYLLSYIELAGYAKRSQQYWIQDGAIATDRAEKGFNLPERDTSQDVKLPNPNPDVEYLNVRGYTDVLAQVVQSRTWDAVSSKTGPAKSLDAVARTIEFPELEQCVCVFE